MLTNLIPWWGRWLVLAALSAALIGFGFVKGNEHRGAKDDAVMNAHLLQDQREADARAAQHLKDQQAAAQQYQQEAQSHARETLRRLDLQADAERKEHATVADLTRRADALALQLRQRPSRPAGDREAGGQSSGSGDSASGAGCTGAGLYLQDGNFLVGEAARSQRVLAERDACYDKYDALRNASQPPPP